MTVIRVLGIDPSLTHTGWVVAEVDAKTRQIVNVLEGGTVVTEPTKAKQVRKSSDKLERARSIANTLRDVIERYGIKIASSEIPSGAKSANAAHAFGIVLGIIAGLTVPVVEVSPREVKLATAGKATADKEDIVRWAVGKSHGWPLVWKTTNRANDWEIMFDDAYVTKDEEHMADALAGVQAAVDGEQFRQLAGFALSLSS